MQDIKPMFKCEESWTDQREVVWWCLRNESFEKYTNYILTNDSELDKEEKIEIKCYFSLLFLFDFSENWIRKNR